ncbi:MAG: aspartyl protease family protein [Ardenticatenales bacterium]|nr:aspartyl protease family protein [Ardenticatenales bacterium]
MSLPDANQPLHSSNAAAIASALWDSADFAGAAEQYERALRESPGDMEALHGLGRLRLAQNDLAAALLLLEQAEQVALALSGSNHQQEWVQRIRQELAWALYRLDRFDLAAQYFDVLPGQEALSAQLRAFGDRIPYRHPVRLDEIVVPFMGTDPLPIINLTIAGQEYPFVIDTGSGQMVVDIALAQALSLEEFGTREITLATGQRSVVAHTLLPEVMLGEIAIKDVPAEVMDIQRFAPQLAGVIGTSFLQHFHVLCDFQRQTLHLYPKIAESPPTGGMTLVSFLLFDAHLILAPVQVNEYQTMGYLVSGMAGAAFTLAESVRQQIDPALSSATRQSIGAGGVTAALPMMAAHLSLGGWSRSDVEGLVGFFPPPLEWRYGFQVGALIGHEFLRGKRFLMDFEQMQLGVE